MATFKGIAPIFPTADFDAMRAHYEALGFTVRVHGGGYGTVGREGVQIHFRHVPSGSSGTGSPEQDAGRDPGATYIAVDDVDALQAEWRAAGVGETTKVFDPGFGVREAAHVDVDGNLIRFGSSAGASAAAS